MSYLDARRHMVKKKLIYKDICTQAVSEYCTQFDNDKWPEVFGISNPKDYPSAFSSAAICGTDAAAIAQAFAICQQMQVGSNNGSMMDHSNNKCLNYGKKGRRSHDFSTGLDLLPSGIQSKHLVLIFWHGALYLQTQESTCCCQSKGCLH